MEVRTRPCSSLTALEVAEVEHEQRDPLRLRPCVHEPRVQVIAVGQASQGVGDGGALHDLGEPPVLAADDAQPRGDGRERAQRGPERHTRMD
jgi:hypothetical protein